MNAVEQVGNLHRRAYVTGRSASTEKNYLCTFLNEAGERVDVFEGLQGETFFLVQPRDGSMARDRQVSRIAA